MNKIILSVLLFLCLALIIYNATKLDFENPLVGDSLVAVIGIFAALCAGILLVIFHLSKKIQEKVK
jgi:uncharacterized integral membrane protein